MEGGDILRHTHTKKNCLVLGAVALASGLLWTAPLHAGDFSFSGESNTIFRMRTTTDNKDLYPAYEYLRLNLTDNRSDGSGVSFHLGAWGRVDLADKSTVDRADGDLQYGFFTYRAAKNNTVVSVGRQFITEGVATEKVDGLYLRNDFAYGLGVAAFFGKSVFTETDLQKRSFQADAPIAGGRITQTDRKYYIIGLSALKSGGDREEEGLDLWLRPNQQVDVTGRSSYNSKTDGWMEHSYAVSYAPLSTLRFGADFAHTSFKDYLYNMTTPAFSIWNDNEKQTAVGANVAYTVIKDLSIAADYKFYSYDQSGDASYFGGKATYALPEALVVGAGIHRMNGDVDKLRYVEFRGFASKKIGHADLTVDALSVNYDKRINDIKSSYSVTGAAGYEFNRKLKVGADLEYSRNPDFDSEVRALLKATYTFDTKFAAEGGTKSEK
jgi:hypothetical protein